MARFYPGCDGMQRGVLLERLLELSVSMLRAATTAMAIRRPVTEFSLAELAGGCLAFSGSDVPLTRAVGVGTAGTVGEDGPGPSGIFLSIAKLGGAGDRHPESAGEASDEGAWRLREKRHSEITEEIKALAEQKKTAEEPHKASEAGGSAKSS